LYFFIDALVIWAKGNISNNNFLTINGLNEATTQQKGLIADIHL